MDLPGDADGGLFLRGQTGNNFAMAADPIDPNVVFVSGDQETDPFPRLTVPQPPSIGPSAATPEPVGRQWRALIGIGASGTMLDADSRDLKFDPRRPPAGQRRGRVSADQPGA